MIDKNVIQAIVSDSTQEDLTIQRCEERLGFRQQRDWVGSSQHKCSKLNESCPAIVMRSASQK